MVLGKSKICKIFSVVEYGHFPFQFLPHIFHSLMDKLPELLQDNNLVRGCWAM